MKEVMNVPNTPPTNPSLVFFGEILIKGVLPMDIPTKYAEISFKTTAKTAIKNQK